MSFLGGLSGNDLRITQPLWHLTSKPDFKIDPHFQPQHAYGYRAQTVGKAGLFVTDQPNYWSEWVPTKNLYAVRIQPSSGLQRYDSTKPEYIDTNPAEAQVLEILPILEAVNRYPKQFGRAEFAMYRGKRVWDEDALAYKEYWYPRQGFERPHWFPKNPVKADY